MVPPSPPRSRVKCEIFRTNVLEDGWGYRPQAASVSEPRARPSENMAQIRGLVPVLPSQRNSDLGFCHPREPKCPFATAPRGPNRAFAPTFPPPQRIQPACPSDVPPEPGRAARARSRIGRELRVPAKPERIIGVKEVSERRRGAAYCPAFGPSGLGAAPRPKQGARWRASAPRSVGRELRAPARSEHKKRSGPAEGAAGPEGGGMRLSQEPLSAFQRQSRQVIGGGCLTCWAQYNNHP